MEKITSYLIKSTVTDPGVVKAWEETIMIPSYEIGSEEKNPMFLEKRVYQGSSGVVYPYPVVERIYDEKIDKPYNAVFLENQYLKIMILPELGGRIQMAYDKIKNRHFVYYNQVIKPALVGLTGPWISGGIEFNWPQHHRPSTFLPTEHIIEENEDGSITVWCNEVERMFRTKGMQGFTLYPDKAYLEIKVKIYNRTSFPQTFLWWANPAVHVNDHYKSVFPPDVHAVFDHGKRDVSSFPIARGIYYKQDYSSGVDISKYKNIPVPTSYMAVKSKYDFVGGYEDDTQGGLLHVANHHVSPGKKQWTWGNGDFGQAWDRNLTDEDGPYIELMTGVFTDNQPDFSWLQPYEEKSWSQFFMPYSQVGYVKNANKDIILHLSVEDSLANVIVYATSNKKDIKITLNDNNSNILLDEVIDISPEKPYQTSVKIDRIKEGDLTLTIMDNKGKILLNYLPEENLQEEIPEPAKAALNPKEIELIEDLYLTGLHLEQYRHATYNPFDYYDEALKRDEYDIRCNNAKGLLLMRRGKYAESKIYFENAIKKLTEKNPNPYEGEPFYNLGYALKLERKEDLAYDSFFKATWNAAWQDPAYFCLAQIDCQKSNWGMALENVEKSLLRNWHNHRARQLKSSVLRKLGKNDEALKWVNSSLEIDQFNLGCILEKYFLTGDDSFLKKIKSLFKNKVHTYIEYALDFLNAGLLEESGKMLNLFVEDKENVYPMVYYILGYIYNLKKDNDKCLFYYKEAQNASPEKCFPNRLEELVILKNAISVNPGDAKAHYYLGNFWYANRQYDDAIKSWETSVEIDDAFPTALRNLSLAYFNKLDKKEEALKLLEKAFSLDKNDARILFELDQLYKKLNKSHIERLNLLEEHIDLVSQRDDLFIERITLYNQLGEFEKAKDLISTRHFHPWEGGEGKITGQYVVSRVQLAKRAITDENYSEALQLLNETDAYPHNLGEGKLSNAEENDIEYFKGVSYRGLGDYENAKKWFAKATKGAKEPQQAFFYNDQNPDKIYYQGLAWKELEQPEKAIECFTKLIKHGEKHLNDNCKLDYFAVSLPDLAIWEEDLNKRNRIHCYYVMALGESGMGNYTKSDEFFNKVLDLDINHLGARFNRDILIPH